MARVVRTEPGLVARSSGRHDAIGCLVLVMVTRISPPASARAAARLTRWSTRSPHQPHQRRCWDRPGRRPLTRCRRREHPIERTAVGKVDQAPPRRRTVTSYVSILDQRSRSTLTTSAVTTGPAAMIWARSVTSATPKGIERQRSDDGEKNQHPKGDGAEDGPADTAYGIASFGRVNRSGRQRWPPPWSPSRRHHDRSSIRIRTSW